MKTRKFWVVITIAVIFMLGGVLNLRSEAQSSEPDGYKKQAEEKLKDIGKKIKELEKKGAAMKEETKADFKDAMKDLKGKEMAAKKKLKALKKAGAEKMDKARSDMDDAFHSLESSLEKAVSWFKSKEPK